MSHFTTIVVVREATDAKDAERQAEEALAPFVEELDEPFDKYGETRTAVVDDTLWWRTDENMTDEKRAECERDYAGGEPKDRTTPEWHQWAMARLRDEWGENNVLFDEEKGYGYKSHINPIAQWDWYSLGGRWHNFFPLKDPLRFFPRNGNDEILGGGPGAMGQKADTGQADGARKKDIDFATARENARIKAEAEYDLVDRIVEKHGEVYTPWSDFVQRLEAEEITIDQARADYRAQPLVAAFNARDVMDKLGFMTSPSDFFIGTGGREAYVQHCTNRALVPFSILLDGEWYEKGKMGWWGMVSDEKGQEEWNAKVAELYDTLADDAWLILMDCHI